MTTPVELQGPSAPSAPSGLVRGLAVATAVVFLVGMVGLGTIKPSAPRSRDVLATVYGAASKTTSITSARMSMSAQTGVSDSSAKMPELTMDGAIQFAPDRRLNLTLHVATISIQALQVGTEAYLRVPDRVRNRVATPWISVDVPDPSTNAFSSLAGPTMPGGGDPTATLSRLQASGVVKSATQGDRKSVRGTSTTVYHLVLDAAAFKQALSAQMKDNPAASAFFSDQVKLSDPKFDLYIDDGGLVRRQVMTLSTSLSGGPKPVNIGVTATTDLFDFNQPVVVNPPPANQVTHVASLAEAQRLLSGAG